MHNGLVHCMNPLVVDLLWSYLFYAVFWLLWRLLEPAGAAEDEEDELEFYDALVQESYGTGSIGTEDSEALSEDGEGFPLQLTASLGRIPIAESLYDPSSSPKNLTDDTQWDSSVATFSTGSGILAPTTSARQRRTTVPEKPTCSASLWGIMKNCIGKDLSKIPLPVTFSEPLSFLQRLTEDFEYAEILDTASTCQDASQQLAYLAAFTVSAYSTTSSRTGKPFNPLLSETYECDRVQDLGWRVINEQVSHHPPITAQYCEGKNWTSWQEFTMHSKFLGKYIQVIPFGDANVEFPVTGTAYSWKKVTTLVHNIVVGKLWIDQTGDMVITGKKKAAGLKCYLKYIPYSYFVRDQQRRVKGVVVDAQEKAKWTINGIWDDNIEIAPVVTVSGSADNRVYETGPAIVAWKRRMPAADAEKYYGFTVLACQLNEMEEGVAPTDSRLRPDQRLMENGLWDEANIEKVRLEEKQRERKRQRDTEATKAASEGRPHPAYQPVWFEPIKKPGSDLPSYKYKGGYWEAKAAQNWSRCPGIFQ